MAQDRSSPRPHHHPGPWRKSVTVSVRVVGSTYIVLGLLILIALLVGSGLLLIWLALLLAQSLPAITQDLADLT
jgi:hypothetical protein